MILAAGLTPAWQQVLVFDALRMGEVNRAVQTHWFASGKVINVARALSNLKANSRIVCLLGGPSGEHIANEFASDGIPARWIRTGTPTRVCTTLLQNQGGETTELVENAGETTPAEIESYRQAFAEEAKTASTIVLSGSLPRGVPEDFYAELLGETDSPAILDIRGPELMATLTHDPFCVKPNRHELELTVGHDCSRTADLIARAREICTQGATWVLVTDGPQPSWLISIAEAIKFIPPSVTVVNPIGAGDCLTATLAWAIDRGETMIDAVRLAIAAASEDTSLLLPARFDSSRIAHLAESVQVERFETN